jgi:putative tRNA adenosine deaminase-associated protein
MWVSRSLPVPEDALLALLALAAVAGGGLTRADLAALTGYTPDELDAHLAAVSRTGLCQRASRWTGETIYLVEDAQQRQDIMAAAGQAVLADCGEALHAWAEAYRGRGWPATTPQYLLDGYFRLLESTGDPARMTACATDPRRHERLLELTGGDVAAVYEVATCQAALAEQNTPDLAAAVILAVVREQLTRRNDKLPASLPATVAASGDPVRAEQLASSITDPAQQAKAFASLAIALLDHGHLEQARHTFERLATVVSTLTVTSAHWPPHPALAAVAELAAAGQWTSAERVARSITDQEVRAQALRSLVSAQITDGHLDQAEHLALSINPSKGHPDSEALRSVVAALATSGQYHRAEALARAFPDRRASDDYGGILALPELVTAVAVAGENEKLHELIRCTPHEQIRDRLLTGAVAAVAQAGDFGRAESLARSISSNYSARQALAEVVNELLAAGERDRAIALARSVATDYPPGEFLRPRQEPDRSPEQHLNDILHDRRQPSRTQGPAEDEEIPGLARRVGLALTYLDAGDLDKAVRTAHAASGSLLNVRILCSLATALVERGKIERAEKLAHSLDERRGQAEVLAAAAAASAAHGDSASAQRLAARAATLARTSTFDNAAGQSPILDILVQDLGEDHPDTLAFRNNLAYAYLSAGDLGRAVPLFEQTPADTLRVLGTDHPLTGMVRANLARAHAMAERDTGGAEEARPLADETRQLGKQVRRREQDAAEAAGRGDSPYYDDIDGPVVAVIRGEQRWRCELLHGAAQRQLADVERELAEAAGRGAVVFGLIDVDDEFVIILRPGPAKTRLVLSDATAGIDYEIAADVLRELNREIPDLDPDSVDDVEPWPEGDLDLLADVGLDERTLVKLFAGDLYPDEQILEIAKRLGFEAELLAAVDEYVNE